MYSDEDLNYAAEKGIFTLAAVEQFRADILKRNNTHRGDEEHFRLITSFNDIFVVLACLLLLFSSFYLLEKISHVLAIGVTALLSWGLAEFFVLKRKMALPAIFLLCNFVGHVFVFVFALLLGDDYNARAFYDLIQEHQLILILASVAAAASAWLHWWRFKVPITVAAGALASGTLFITTLTWIFPATEPYLKWLISLAGIAVFYIGLRFDGADLNRTTRKSDVAFWLHLVAAPMIIHPIFSSLPDHSDQGLLNAVIVLVLYLVVMLISLVIDRRAFMVAALIYILTALNEIFEAYGVVSSFAYVGVCIGFSLLLLAGFWHSARSMIVTRLPHAIQNRFPSVR